MHANVLDAIAWLRRLALCFSYAPVPRDDAKRRAILGRAAGDEDDDEDT